MEWDHHEYKVAGDYLPALINADPSGLEDSEAADLDAWEAGCRADVPEGWTASHWGAPESEADDWGQCSVSGLFAGRATVRLYFYREA